MTLLKIVDGGRLATAGNGGPEDPMLEKRVSELEKHFRETDKKLTEILLLGAKQSDVAKVNVDLAELKGKVSMLPTTWTLLVAILVSSGAVAGVNVAISKLTQSWTSPVITPATPAANQPAARVPEEPKMDRQK